MNEVINLCRQFLIFLSPSGKVMMHRVQPTDSVVDGRLFLDTGELVGQVLGRAQGDALQASWECDKYRAIHEVHND